MENKTRWGQNTLETKHDGDKKHDARALCSDSCAAIIEPCSAW